MTMTIRTVWWQALLSICAFAMPLEDVIQMPSVASATESRADIITHTGETNSLQKSGAQSRAEIDQVTNLSNQAEEHKKQGRYAEAESLYRRALEIREKALGKYHPDTARSLNNLKAMGEDHPLTMTSRVILAFFYYSQRKYAEAEPLYRHELEIHEKALGPDHPVVGTNLWVLAKTPQSAGKLRGGGIFI